MKVKIFNGDSLKVEGIINDWLNENKRIRIVEILQSESQAGKTDEWSLTITIFYSEINLLPREWRDTLQSITTPPLKIDKEKAKNFNLPEKAPDYAGSVNEKPKEWAFLFIHTNTSMSIEIIAETYKEADSKLAKMIESEDIPGSDWRCDSRRLID